ncbi:hypothetical protein EWM64_g322 [Hericium alpestre]|uniref:Uncharacterized protein n=1 Tax=Hericium alpestre TaxID=135208 RepID=A0A4Z0A9G0_9AGAM|nr:hypothetical protein EWM64_g322 [Hericium alpestre]
MSAMADYACKCLNVRIRAQPAEGPAPAVAGDDFVPVFVGEQGISATLVYRVEVIVPPSMDGGEGPVLPTEEWVDHEVLKSSSGWIELSKQCLDQPSIAKTESSPNYSPVFRVVLPLLDVAEATSHYIPSAPASSRDQPPHKSLPPLAPLFPPAPFIPSHPTFGHLARLASEQSQNIRQTAEEYLSEITRTKLAEIEHQEADLRAQVGRLWVHFKEALAPFEQEKKELQHAPPTGSHWTQGGAALGSGQGTPVSVQDFVPVSSTPRRSASPSHLHRAPSALSASLVTTGFHHPDAARTDSRSSAATVTSETGSSETRVGSPGAESQRTLGNAVQIASPGSSLREAYRRDMSEDKDIATSFKYVVDMDAMAHARGRPGRPPSPESSKAGSKPPPPPATPPSSRKAAAGEASGSGLAAAAKTAKKEVEVREAPSPGKASKGKRKVTFDIKPDVEIIDQGSPSPANRDEEAAAIFDLDDTAAEQSEADAELLAKMTLPIAEPHISARPRQRSTSGSNLPQSFLSLRPASLPAPSHLRRPSTPEPPPPSTNGRSEQANGHGNAVNGQPQEPLSPREEELMKLVAADVPSHRGTWKRDSKAWQQFVNRKGAKDQFSGPTPLFDEAEQDDVEDRALDGGDGSGRPGRGSASSNGNDKETSSLATSLPISILPLSEKRKISGVPSYQPKTSLPYYYGALVPPLPPVASSVSMRKAAYAERDRERSLDPGALDFAADEEEEEESSDDSKRGAGGTTP